MRPVENAHSGWPTAAASTDPNKTSFGTALGVNNSLPLAIGRSAGTGTFKGNFSALSERSSRRRTHRCPFMVGPNEYGMPIVVEAQGSRPCLRLLVSSGTGRSHGVRAARCLSDELAPVPSPLAAGVLDSEPAVGSYCGFAQCPVTHTSRRRRRGLRRGARFGCARRADRGAGVPQSIVGFVTVSAVPRVRRLAAQPSGGGRIRVCCGPNGRVRLRPRRFRGETR